MRNKSRFSKNEVDKFEINEDSDYYSEYRGFYPKNAEELSKKRSWNNISGSLSKIIWDWKLWIAKGYLVMLVGASGIGKSILLLRLCGCYTDGWNWLDGTKFEGEKGMVLWCEGEAAQSLNLSRAKLMGLDTSKLLMLFDDPFKDFDMENVEHNRALSDLAQNPNIKLIVIDSYSGVHAGDENSSEMNRNISFLAKLARDTQKPIILTHHLRKKGQFEGNVVNLDRVRGSSAIVQTARVIIAIDQPNPKSSVKRLNVIKNNLSVYPKPIGFRITDKGVQLLSAPQEPGTKSELDRCKVFLIHFLANGPVDAEAGKKAAEDEGLAQRTLDEAKKQLGVLSKKIGGSKGKWQWSLPGSDEDPCLPDFSGPQIPPNIPELPDSIGQLEPSIIGTIPF